MFTLLLLFAIVLHAGIYYSPSSLKAKSCIVGKDLLRNYINDRSIPYSECGKLIVSTTSDDLSRNRLLELYRNGLSCGLREDRDINLLSKIEVRELEPAISCEAAIISHRTAIFSRYSFFTSVYYFLSITLIALNIDIVTRSCNTSYLIAREQVGAF